MPKQQQTAMSSEEFMPTIAACTLSIQHAMHAIAGAPGCRPHTCRHARGRAASSAICVTGRGSTRSGSPMFLVDRLQMQGMVAKPSRCCCSNGAQGAGAGAMQSCRMEQPTQSRLASPVSAAAGSPAGGVLQHPSCRQRFRHAASTGGSAYIRIAAPLSYQLAHQPPAPCRTQMAINSFTGRTS